MLSQMMHTAANRNLFGIVGRGFKQQYHSVVAVKAREGEKAVFKLVFESVVSLLLS